MKKLIVIYLIVLILLNSNSFANADYSPIYKGESGQHVVDLQTKLVSLGYDTNGIDGNYGGGTESAVMNFQYNNGLEVTGIADSKTLSLLFDGKTDIPVAESTQPTEETAPTVLSSPTATAAPKSTEVPLATFKYNGRKHSLKWESEIRSIPKSIRVPTMQRQMPYWADPGKLTDSYAGYIAEVPRDYKTEFYFGSLNAEQLTLYYAYLYTPDGYSDAKESAQLYMAEYTLDNYLREDEVNSFIEECTELYGEPTLLETTSESLINHGNGWETVGENHYEYLWNTYDNTGIRLSLNYEPWSYRYPYSKLYIGRTNMDNTLREGKLLISRGFVQAAVAGNSIPLYNNDGSYNLNIDHGTMLMITDYVPSMNMFSVDVVISGSDVQISESGIHGTGWRSNHSGLITGNDINVSRDALLYYFTVDSSTIPTMTPLESPQTGTDYTASNSRSAAHQYVLNVNTMKFHDPYCRAVSSISDYNRLYVEMSRDEITAQGYSPCQICNP